MKKLLLLPIFVLLCATLSAQTRWNMGIGLGGTTNCVQFDSGDEMANALFRANYFSSGSLNISFSYKLNEKFSLQSGMDFTEFGFSYSFLKDYSLKDEWMCEPDISASTCITSLPLMFVARTPKTCWNMRFVFGAGFAVRFIDEQWDMTESEDVTISESGVSKTTQVLESAHTVNSVSPAFTWMMGMEKVFRRENSIGFYFKGNQGFNTIAESTVDYRVDGKAYTHTFINRGSFVNFSIAYNFAAFGTRKALKAAAAIPVAPVAP